MGWGCWRRRPLHTAPHMLQHQSSCSHLKYWLIYSCSSWWAMHDALSQENEIKLTWLCIWVVDQCLHHSVIVSRDILTWWLYHMIFSPGHCITWYSHQVMVSRDILTWWLYHMILSPGDCITWYSHRVIVSRDILTGWLYHVIFSPSDHVIFSLGDCIMWCSHKWIDILNSEFVAILTEWFFHLLLFKHDIPGPTMTTLMFCYLPRSVTSRYHLYKNKNISCRYKTHMYLSSTYC